MNEIKSVSLEREDLEKIINVFDTKSKYVHFMLEIDTIEGDQILWVDNGKFGNDRAYIRINIPHKEGE